MLYKISNILNHAVESGNYVQSKMTYSGVDENGKIYACANGIILLELGHKKEQLWNDQFGDLQVAIDAQIPLEIPLEIRHMNDKGVSLKEIVDWLVVRGY